MKRNLKMLLAAVIVLGLLVGGYFLLLKWEPEKEAEEVPAEETSKTEYLTDAELDSIDYIEINNGTDLYKITNGEETKVEGYSSHILDESAFSSVLSNAARITISHKVNADMSDVSGFGLDKPQASVLIKLKDGKAEKVLIGSSANFEGEYYAMLEGGAFVCTIPSYEVENIMTSPSEYRSLEICTLDRNTARDISISREGKRIVSVEYDEDYVPKNEYQAVSFLVTYPYSNVTASLDKLDALFENFAPLTAESIVEENPAKLSTYGLDKPYVLSVKDSEGKTNTIKMGEYGEGDSVYVMLNDLPVVYLAKCPFYQFVKEAVAVDFVDRFINLINIQLVEEIELKFKDEVHSLEIISKGEDKYQYKKNGKLISEDKFKDIYQLIIGVTATDFADKAPSGEEKCKITFKLTDKTEKTFTYYIYDERYSIVKGDNGMNCLALSKNLDNILTELSRK